MLLQNQRRIRATKAEAQVQRATDIARTMAFNHIIQIAALIRLLEIGRRGNNAVGDRLQADDALEGARRGD